MWQMSVRMETFHVKSRVIFLTEMTFSKNFMRNNKQMNAANAREKEWTSSVDVATHAIKGIIFWKIPCFNVSAENALQPWHLSSHWLLQCWQHALFHHCSNFVFKKSCKCQQKQMYGIDGHTRTPPVFGIFFKKQCMSQSWLTFVYSLQVFFLCFDLWLARRQFGAPWFGWASSVDLDLRRHFVTMTSSKSKQSHSHMRSHMAYTWQQETCIFIHKCPQTDRKTTLLRQFRAPYGSWLKIEY